MVEGDEKPGPSSARADRQNTGRSRVVDSSAPPPEPGGEAPDEQEEVSADIEEEVIPIAQDVLKSSMNDLNELLTQVRVRPYFRQGKPEGLIVSQIQPDSIFEKIFYAI